jgi:hypothetical protein
MTSPRASQHNPGPHRRGPIAISRPRPRPHLDHWRVAGLALAGAFAAAVVASSGVAAQEWQLTQIDQGTKPAIAVAPDGTPAIIYMLERQDGWVRIAQLQDGEWQSEQIVDGYFYGPPDIAAGPDGTFHGAYHDHQDSTFKPDKGDAVHIRGNAGDWTLTTAVDAGHDGWDNRITVDADGQPHMVGVDPEEFGGTDAVEYYSLDADGAWLAEPVGSGPQTYRWAVSIAVDSDGDPWVSYYDGATTALMLAGRDASGWSIETVDDSGNSGLYSELAIDGEGGLHISYFELDDETNGSVKHAYRAGPEAEWQLSTVDTLEDVLIGFTGARNITSIDIGPDGTPWVAYSDESVMRLAHLEDGAWLTETVTEAGDLPLGQIVSLAIDLDGRPHLAFADVTDKSELDGNIWYATRG